MPCYHPIPGDLTATRSWKARLRLPDGKTVSSLRAADGDGGYLEIPCRKCIGCRLDRAAEWSARCMHEASLYPVNAWLTLTYSDENVPPGASLRHRDVQLWLKRLRKAIAPQTLRYYLCGEYGDANGRPHYHVILFGYQFPDLEKWRKKEGRQDYRSALLEKTWGLGNTEVTHLTKEAADYTARYIMKKITGDLAESHYRTIDLATGQIVQREAEYNRMSTHPGIGAAWFEKFQSDVFPHDAIVGKGGVKRLPPRYYTRILKRKDPLLVEDVKAARLQNARKDLANNTPARLAVREEVRKAGIRNLKRPI